VARTVVAPPSSVVKCLWGVFLGGCGVLFLSCACVCRCRVSLYKILFYFKALLWESIILLVPPSTCKAYPIAVLLHDHCATYASPTDPSLYAIHRTILVMAISCKGQVSGVLFSVGVCVCDLLIFLYRSLLRKLVFLFIFNPGACLFLFRLRRRVVLWWR